ncbi:integrase [Polaribacter pacificus]|uniref:Tyrosine recombinase XerC n=2 Tax=Polaribacter pacificus TaxID=1775173 RepID=A0A917HSI2_9FLAO|nr:integrase [Polaribacter pacificus]
MMLIDSFLEYLLFEKKYSKHTVIAYKNDLRTFKEYLEITYGGADLIEVNYAQIRSWIVSLVDGGVSNNSINRKISSLKSFYKFLQKTSQLTVSPLLKHKALKVAKKVQVPFTMKEINEVIEVLSAEDDFKGLRNRLIVELFYSTGIRRIELVDLDLRSVDVTAKTIKVVGKRNKERVVPLIPSVLGTIDKYLAERAKIPSQERRLFIGEKGNKINETLVYRVINQYFSNVSSKVKKSPHILRHSFATHLLNEGADLNSVKELLGHASLASTQVYTHNSLESIKKMYNQAHPRSHKNK